MSKQEIIGNSTTIGKFIATTIAGWIIALCAAKGLNLGIDAVTLAEIIGAIIGLIYGYIDAKYPNTFNWLGNAVNTLPESEILNDEYTAPDMEADDSDQ